MRRKRTEYIRAKIEESFHIDNNVRQWFLYIMIKILLILTQKLLLPFLNVLQWRVYSAKETLSLWRTRKMIIVRLLQTINSCELKFFFSFFLLFLLQNFTNHVVFFYILWLVLCRMQNVYFSPVESITYRQPWEVNWWSFYSYLMFYQHQFNWILNYVDTWLSNKIA